MSAHAERVYPEECCGLMLGNLQKAPQQKQLVELAPLNNEWSPENLTSQGVEVGTVAANAVGTSTVETHTKRRRYWIDPKDMLRVQREARNKGLSIIGVYHSHPDHVAEPSECDRALAWPEYAYVIVSVCEGKAVDVQNWALDSEPQFQPEVMKQWSSSLLADSTVLLS